MRILLTFSLAFALFGLQARAEGPEDRFRPMMDQAVTEQKAGNHKAAVKLFKKVHAKSQMFKKDAFARLVDSLSKNKQWDEAVEVLNAEIEKSPFVGEYRVWLADTHCAAGNDAAAFEAITFAEKILGDADSVLRGKALIQQHLGKHEDAVATYNQYLVKSPKAYKALADRARSYSQLNQPAKAYADLQAAYTLRPFDEDIVASLTKAALALGNHADVRNYGQKCVDLYPANISCLESLGLSAAQSQDASKAVKYFETALALDSYELENRLHYAEVLAQSGRDGDSDAQFIVIFQQRPSYEPAMRSWVELLKKRRNLSALGDRLREFSERAPDNLWVAAELAKLLVLVGNKEEAAKTIKSAVKAHPTEAALLYHAYVLSSMGEDDDAQELLRQITDEKLAKNFHLGLVFLKQKNYGEAIRHWQAVPENSALRFQAQVNAALAFEAQGELARAKALLAALPVPAEYKPSVDKKIVALSGAEERKPAASKNPVGIELTYFLEWKLPRL